MQGKHFYSLMLVFAISLFFSKKNIENAFILSKKIFLFSRYSSNFYISLFLFPLLSAIAQEDHERQTLKFMMSSIG